MECGDLSPLSNVATCRDETVNSTFLSAHRRLLTANYYVI